MTHSKKCSKKGGSSNCKAKFGAYSSRDGPDTCSKLHHRSPYNQNFRVRSFGVLPNESSMTHFHIFTQNLSKFEKNTKLQIFFIFLSWIYRVYFEILRTLLAYFIIEDAGEI